MSDPIFQRGLQDLIKGIRSHKRDPSAFISQGIAEIKSELSSTDPVIKAEAVRKLTYLQMIGYNVSWAAFAIVEVMSQHRFAHKRIGYMAANQSFDEATDVILLTTNLFKKEFSAGSNNQYEIGLAINCLANIATKDLARDCISDLVTLMNHSKAYIRKKAVLAMYKLYVKYPQGLRLTFEKLKDRLDDSESSVVSTAVNVICELANKNPKNYLAMAPKFFKLLTTSSNNWMLIKVVKLLGSLVSEEPRLARKLLDPMASIIQSTQAKSLQYECIFTITEGLPFAKRDDGSEAKNTAAIVQLCSDYLRGFIEDNDQNLKYLGLVGLVNLMRSYPRVVVEHRDLVLKCLNDDDVTIRTKALELLAGIVSRKSLVDLVHHLLEHARRSEGEYRDEIISKIMSMCKREKYSLVEDFAWYTSILLELSVMKGSKHGKEVAEQLIDVSLRVDTVRPYAVESMISMLLNEKLFLGQARFTVSEVLKAAAWIVGEYSDIITAISRDDAPDDAEDGNAYWIDGASVDEFRSDWRGQNVHVMIIDTLLHSRSVNLPAHVQSVYIQSAMKIFVRACCDCDLASVAEVMKAVRSQLPVYLQSQYLEVQERSSTFRHLLVALNILPLNWEETTEQVTNEHEEGEVVSEQQAALDLLDMPVYTAGSIKAVDDRGAQMSIDQREVLRTAIAENFYAVHSKAQSRVPVPEGLNLEAAFQLQALNDLLNVEIEENLSVHALRFVPPLKGVQEAGDQSGASRSNVYSDEPSKDFNKSSNNGSYADPFESPSSNAYSSHSASGAAGGRTNRGDDVFMLSGGSDAKQNNSIIPLSKILGDNFQDSATGGKKSKRSKGSKSSSSSKNKNINTVDLLPAGFEASDEETDKQKKTSRKKKSKSGYDDGEDIALDAVDLSTPLREDEVFATHKHRVVPSTRPEEDEAAPAVATAKKDKKKSKKHSKHQADDDQPGAASELLSLDFGGDSLISKPAATAELKAPIVLEANKKTKEDFVSLVLHSTDLFSITYSISLTSSKSVSVQFRTTNHAGDDLNISLLLASSSAASVKGSSTSLLAANLGTGKVSGQSLDLTLNSALSGSSVNLPCTIIFSTDSLLEPVSKNLQSTLHVSLCTSFNPLVLSETEYESALSKNAASCGSSKVQVSSTVKSKYSFKAIASFLHAHIVESEQSKAVSLCARTASGHAVYVLLKAKSDHVSADLKCVASSKSDSEELASEIVHSLSMLSL